MYDKKRIKILELDLKKYEKEKKRLEQLLSKIREELFIKKELSDIKKEFEGKFFLNGDDVERIRYFKIKNINNSIISFDEVIIEKFSSIIFNQHELGMKDFFGKEIHFGEYSEKLLNVFDIIFGR